MDATTKRRTVVAFLLAQENALDVAVKVSTREAAELHTKSNEEIDAEMREAMAASLNADVTAVAQSNDTFT